MAEHDGVAIEFPLQRSFLDPPPEYAQFRASCPFAPATIHGQKAWLVSRYDDVRQALSDPKLSADKNSPNFPELPGRRALPPSAGLPSFIRMDPPQHGALRRLITRDFTIRNMEALRPRIQQLTDELIDGILAGPKPADLVTALALPLPSTVICWLLGVPLGDMDFFADRSSYMFSRGVTFEERAEKLGDLNTYLYELIDRKEAEPGDDIISRLVVEQLAPGNIDRRTLQGMAFMLLIAGHETSSNMISLGTLALLQHRDQFADLGKDPALVKGAVEELLRYLTVLNEPNWRVAVADTEIGEHPIRAGEVVMALTLSANRDEKHYPEADKLDIRRGARDHLAFGYGIHQCLGQPLARVELQVVYGTLARRIPTLELAVASDEVKYKNDVDIYGLHELPVTW